MQLAHQEAQRFHHEYLGTEHILLGLVQEGSGVAAHVLKNLDIDLRKIRREVEKIVQPGPGAIRTGRLPQTPKAKKVIEYAIEEARGLNHNYVGTEHMLLGLLRDQEGVAAQVLLNLGLQLEAVRAEVRNLLGHAALPAPHVQPRKDGSEHLARHAGAWVRKYGAIFAGGVLSPVVGAGIGALCVGAEVAESVAELVGVLYLAAVTLAWGVSRCAWQPGRGCRR
jgi:ATP-dependent Clp protease ATP-binding subunit ClpC